MKNILTLFLLGLLSLSSSFAQSSWNWVKPFGGSTREEVRKISKDKDGNTLLCGIFTSDSFYFHGVKIKKNIVEASEQIFVIKFAPNDSLIWFKIFGVAGQEEGCDMTIDSFDNVYSSYYSNDNNNTSLVKINKNGTIDWTKNYPNAKGKSLLCSFNDKIILATKDSIYSYLPTGQKINARREPLVSSFYTDKENGFYFADGNSIKKSDQQLFSLSLINVANEQNIRINSFYVDENYAYSTGIIATTFTNGTFSASGAQNMFVFKQNINGTGEWLKSASGQSHVTPYKLIHYNDRVIVCGHYRNFATFDTLNIGAWGLFEEAFVVSYDTSNGKVLGFVNGGGGGDDDIAYDMFLLNANELLVAGVVQKPSNGFPYFGNIKVNSTPGASDCFYASLAITKPLSKFSGTVLRNSLPFISKVRLYKFISNNSIQVFSETNTDDFGKYSFSFSDTGTYFVKAFDQGGTFIDSYEPNAFRWENAIRHHFAAINTLSNVNINILEPIVTTGVDTISGSVLKSNNDPLRFIRVILTDTNNVFINYTKTDTFGHYDFFNVPFGAYRILLDTTGVFLDSFYTLVVDSNYINFTYDYTLVGNTLKVVHNIISGIEANQETIFSVFPNPSSKIIFVAGNSRVTSFEIIDYTGRILLSDRYTFNGIDIEKFASGIYSLHLHDENNTNAVIRFVKH